MKKKKIVIFGFISLFVVLALIFGSRLYRYAEYNIFTIRTNYVNDFDKYYQDFNRVKDAVLRQQNELINQECEEAGYYFQCNYLSVQEGDPFSGTEAMLINPKDSEVATDSYFAGAINLSQAEATSLSRIIEAIKSNDNSLAEIYVDRNEITFTDGIEDSGVIYTIDGSSQQNQIF